MIARIWRGATRLEDAEAYLAYLGRTGLAEYRATPGNAGAWVLWRAVGEEAEFIALSFWESDYPEDDRFLIRRELTVEHYRLIAPTP